MMVKRIGGIDLLRGAAIIVMIIANSCPYLLTEPYPYLFRFVNSLAAPLFIFLSGFSLMYTLKFKSSYSQKFRQALYLFCSAALLDLLVWKIQPFQTFDVLYLIASGVMISLLLARAPIGVSLAVIVLSMSGSAFLPGLIHYRLDLQENSVADLMAKTPTSFFDVKRFLFDGWFPFMPWVMFSVAGSVWARKFEMMQQRNKFVFVISALFFLVFSVLLFLEKKDQPLRDGYLELFYPPDIIYVTTAISFVIMIFSSIKYQFQSTNLFSRLLRLLGRNSLFLYLFHATVISFVFDAFFEPGGLLFFVLMMSLFAIIMVLMAYLVQSLKQKGFFKRVPYFIRSILGLR